MSLMHYIMHLHRLSQKNVELDGAYFQVTVHNSLLLLVATENLHQYSQLWKKEEKGGKLFLNGRSKKPWTSKISLISQEEIASVERTKRSASVRSNRISTYSRSVAIVTN